MDNEKLMKEFEERIDDLLDTYFQALKDKEIELAEATALLIETGLDNLNGHVYNIRTEKMKGLQ